MVSKKAIGCIVTVVLVVVAVVVLSVRLTPRTAKFKATFMKRCEAYGETSHICEKTLATFQQAYVGKKHSDFSEGNYDQLFAETPFKHPCGKTMFWSKTKDLAHEFTKKRDCLFTLEDTLLGSVLDGLEWCGKEGNNETFTEHCTENKTNPVSSFWKTASTRFAQHACGEVSVMLNGEIDEPYNANSFFGGVEVPNLRSPRVTQLTVVLVTKENKNQCNNESLKNLNNILKGKEIVYACKEVTQSHIEKCIREKKTCGACW
uniref:ADP-ribosyl cyclase/cyclic ADP-ribose hydrolase 1-like n=1 Tax=Semicossyphus pulcher TaxID=241346 RepID=UPI0037E70C75